MSHLTDEARAAFRDAQPKITAGENSLESIVAANPARRTVLKNGLLGLSMLPMLGALTACGDDEASGSPAPCPRPPRRPAMPSPSRRSRSTATTRSPFLPATLSMCC